MLEHVIIMAAAPDRNMEELTRERPKAMLPILGRPMIAHIMDGFYHAGVRRFTVVVGEREGDVAIWLTSNWHADVQLQFAPLGHQRGTAATLLAARQFINGPFIVTSCDNLITEQHAAAISSYFDKNTSDVALLSLHYTPAEASERAGVLLDPRGRVMYISEKPIGAHQDYMIALPIYAFTPRVMEYLDKVPVQVESGERVITTAIQMMIDDNLLVGAIEASWRIRLDTPEDLRLANLNAVMELGTPVIDSAVPVTATIHPPVYISKGVHIGIDATIGPGVFIETGSSIGAKTIIRESIVLGAHLNAEQNISGEIIHRDQ